MSTIVLLAIGQLRTRHCVVVDGVGRLDLDIHPQVASVRLANRRLGRGAPLPVADRQHPAMQRHLDVLDRQRRGRPGCAAVGGEHAAGAVAPALVAAVGRGAALGDDGVVRAVRGSVEAIPVGAGVDADAAEAARVKLEQSTCVS